MESYGGILGRDSKTYVVVKQLKNILIVVEPCLSGLFRSEHNLNTVGRFPHKQPLQDQNLEDQIVGGTNDCQE